MADDLMSSVELTSSLIEQLGQAFVELEAHNIASSNEVHWKDIEEYFRNLESTMKKKVEELEVKEKEFSERESRDNLLLAEREAVIMSKEQDLQDRVQELKDAAVAAIIEARANCTPGALEVACGGFSNGNKVSSSVDENAQLDAHGGESPQMGENVEGVAVEVNPRAELIQFCEQMDPKGLLTFVMENLKNLPALCKELSVALGSATEPARLVLDALEGFFPPNEITQAAENRDAALDGMRRSCLVLMEALSAFLAKADSAAFNYITPETQQQAKSIGYAWKPKLTGDSTVASNGNSLEAEGLLRLLATFRIASEFDEEELCKYVLAVAHHRQAIELCHSLELTQKIPGLVETLISCGRQIDAVHFIHAFQLSEAFPSVPILKAYLKELRRNSQGNGDAAVQNSNNARELEALRSVIGCVEQYNLEAAYPLEPLYKRVGQLDRTAKGDRKRTSEIGKQKQQQQQKRPRSDGGNYVQRARGGRQGPPAFSRTTYTGVPQRYTPPVASAYSYPVPVQSPYAAQATDQRLYLYAQDDPARRPYTAATPTYGTYLQPSRPGYM